MRALNSFESRRSAQSCRPLRSCRPHSPLRTDWTPYSRSSWFSRFSFESLSARRTFWSLPSGITLDSLGALRPGVTLFTAGSNGPLRPDWTLGSLRSLGSAWISGVSFVSLKALFSLNTLRAGGTPFTNGASGTYGSPRPTRVTCFTWLTQVAFRTLPAWGAGCAGLTTGARLALGTWFAYRALAARGAGCAGLTTGTRLTLGAWPTLRTQWTGRSALT